MNIRIKEFGNIKDSLEKKSDEGCQSKRTNIIVIIIISTIIIIISVIIIMVIKISGYTYP